MLVKLNILFEAIIYCKYNKIEEKYLTDKYLLNQIQNIILFIEKALNFIYELSFIFDNIINHIIYAKDIL